MQKKLIDTLKWVWIAAVLAGAGWYFYEHYQEISQYLGTLSASRLILSFLFLLVGKLLISDVTRLSLKKIGVRLPYKEALSITSVTQLGKYLPGGIWHLAGKYGIYKIKEISTKNTVRALVYENVWLLSSATIIGILLLLISSGQIVCGYIPLLCNSNIVFSVEIGLPFFWLAGMLIFEWIFFNKKRIKAEDFILVLVEQIFIWLIFGLSFWLVFPAQGGYLPQIIGAFSLSWVAGYVAIFAPGGIGIREFLLTIFLGAFFKSGDVAIYATVHRLIWVLAEVFLGGISWLVIGLPVDSSGLSDKQG